MNKQFPNWQLPQQPARSVEDIQKHAQELTQATRQLHEKLDKLADRIECNLSQQDKEKSK